MKITFDEATDWLLMKHVCERLNRKRFTIQKLIKSGELKAHKVGQTWIFLESELQEFIKIWKHRNFKAFKNEANPVALLLIRFNLTYKDFSKLIDSNPDYIRKLVKGNGGPIPEKAMKFFEEMGVNCERLMQKYQEFKESRGLK